MNETRGHSQFPWWFAAIMYPVVKVQDGITKIKTVLRKKPKE